MRSCTPSRVPRVTAAMLLASSRGKLMVASSVVLPGTISAATTSASGVATIEATSRCPIASGSRAPRMAAYSTSTVPAMVAMPQFMTMKSSPRDSRAR